ncbi:MAG: tetratricopeptide repeat protein [Spirochaetota bacterium]
MKNIVSVLALVSIFTAIAYAAPDEDLYQSASKAFDEKAYAIAASQYVRFITEYRDSPFAANAHFYLSVASHYLGEWDKSIRYMNIFLKEYPSSPLRAKAYYWLGQGYYRKKELALAREQYRMLTTKYPADEYAALAAYSIGYIAYEQKRYEEAINEFSLALSNYGKSPVAEEISFRLALSYLANGETDKGSSTLLMAMPRMDAVYRAKASYQLGKIAYERKNIAEAVERFTEAARENTEYTENAVGYLATIALDANDANRAYGITRAFIDKNPRTPVMYVSFLHLRALIARGTVREAAAYWTSVSNIPSTYRPDALSELARALASAGDIAAAERYLHECVQTGNTNIIADTYVAIGDGLRKKGDASEALTNYRFVTASFRKASAYPNAHFGAGASLVMLGATNEAIVHLTNAVILMSVPKDKWAAYYYTADMLAVTGRYTDALALAAAADRFPGAAAERTRLLDLKSYLLTEMKRYREAKPLVQELMATDRADRAYFRAGVIAFNEKDLDTARTHFLAVVVRFPASPAAVSALKELADVEFRLARFKDASEHYRSYAARTNGSESAYAMYRAGFSEFSREQYDDAISFLMTAADMYGEGTGFAKSLLLAGTSHYNAKRYSDAVAIYRRLIERIDTDTAIANDILLDTWYNFANTYAAAGNDSEAEAIYEKILARFPVSRYTDEISMKLADYSFIKRNYARSAEYYDRIAKGVGTYANEARVKRGEALLEAGDYKNAIIVLYGFINDVPSGPLTGHAQYRLALAYERAGFNEDALARYRASISLAGTNMIGDIVEAKSAVVRLLYEMKRFDEWKVSARGFIDDASVPEERRIETILSLAEYAEEKNDTGAAAFYERLVSTGRPAAVEAGLFGLARLRFREKDHASAAKYLKDYYVSFRDTGAHRVDAVFFLAAVSYYSGDAEAAKRYFRYLITTFPDSSRTELSKNILTELLDRGRSAVLDTRTYEIR